MNTGSPALRLALILAALVAVILLPFLFWGESLDRAVPEWLTGTHSGLPLAVLGIGLLMADLFLPVPSSVVSITLCLLLGPLSGALAVATGMFGGFLLGYLLGRLLPTATLRHWVGPALWDVLGRRAAASGAFWIMASRPVPVLAEATAVVAGSLGVPLRVALPAALLSSFAVAACYAAATAAGLSAGGFWLAFIASLLLAALLWWVSRVWLSHMNV